MLSQFSTKRQFNRKRNRKSSKNYAAKQGFHIETLERRVVFSADAFSVGTAVVDSAQVGLEQPERRIVNGQETTEFPSVGIVNNGCTGTLISPTHVLTAAHCTVGVADTQGTFEVGGEVYATADIVDHPEYNDARFDVGYDISIMELAQPVAGVTPSGILRSQPQVGSTLTLVGFGEGGTSQNGSLGDFGNKRVGETELERVTDQHLEWTLDTHREGNTAPGDSGGPAFIREDGQLLVAGVTSGGDNDAHQLGSGSFDTRVDSLAGWIDSVVGNQNPEPTEPTEPTEPATDDHSDRPNENATILTIAETQASTVGEIEAAGDRDAFQVIVEQDSELTIATNSTDGFLDSYLRVYDQDGNLVAENDDFGDSLDSQITIDVGTGTYFFTVGSYDDAGEGAYTANVDVIPLDTAPIVSDVFDDAMAMDVSDNGRARENDSIQSAGDSVVFEYQAVADGRLNIRALDRYTGLDTTLTVYDSQGNELAFNDDARGSRNSRIRLNAIAGETYYIRVAGYETSTGDFSLRVNQRQASRFDATASIPQRYSEIDRIFAYTSDWR